MLKLLKQRLQIFDMYIITIFMATVNKSSKQGEYRGAPFFFDTLFAISLFCHK